MSVGVLVCTVRMGARARPCRSTILQFGCGITLPSTCTKSQENGSVPAFTRSGCFLTDRAGLAFVDPPPLNVLPSHQMALPLVRLSKP